MSRSEIPRPLGRGSFIPLPFRQGEEGALHRLALVAELVVRDVEDEEVELRVDVAPAGHAPASLPSKAIAGRPLIWNRRFSASPTSCSSVLSVWAASIRS